MSAKRYIPALILLGLGATALSAAEFWEKKKYSEWSPKEVEAMLSDSPWAKRVEVMSDGGRSGLSRGGGTGRSSIGDPSREMKAVPRSIFLVRFHTALPMKQAIVRSRFGDQVLKAPEATEALSQTEANYVIGIAGPPRMLPADATGLKEQAQLIIKGRDPIPAADAIVDRGQGGAAVLFMFPRGTNPIKVEEGEFELRVKFPAFGFHRSFKLKELMFEGKLEM